MKTHAILAAGTISIIASGLYADMVVFQNNNTVGALRAFNPNFGDTILGQALDITNPADNQPGIGVTPGGSLFLMQINDFTGQYLWLGTGTVTRTAESSIATLIPTPELPFGEAYYGPALYNDFDSIGDEANFADGWRIIHGMNNLTGAPGVFSTDDIFTVGVEFEREGALHYGFAEFKRTIEVFGGQVDVSIAPVRWGYNDIAGEAAVVIPAPAGSIALIGLGVGFSRRRR
tara:strand:+ start:1165 stop:1860 length:696 start_codon:yes stop_codon:yes gene_type:complete